MQRFGQWVSPFFVICDPLEEWTLLSHTGSVPEKDFVILQLEKSFISTFTFTARNNNRQTNSGIIEFPSLLWLSVVLHFPFTPSLHSSNNGSSYSLTCFFQSLCSVYLRRRHSDLVQHPRHLLCVCVNTQSTRHRAHTNVLTSCIYFWIILAFLCTANIYHTPAIHAFTTVYYICCVNTGFAVWIWCDILPRVNRKSKFTGTSICHWRQCCTVELNCTELK